MFVQHRQDFDQTGLLFCRTAHSINLTKASYQTGKCLCLHENFRKVHAWYKKKIKKRNLICAGSLNPSFLSYTLHVTFSSGLGGRYGLSWVWGCKFIPCLPETFHVGNSFVDIVYVSLFQQLYVICRRFSSQSLSSYSLLMSGRGLHPRSNPPPSPSPGGGSFLN